MKKTIITIIFLLSIPTITWSFQNEPDGFRGIKWGTDFKTLKDMVYIETDPSFGGMKVYIKKGDKMQTGGAKLAAVFYFFWQNKFTSVRITTQGSVNFGALKDVCFEKFGQGYQDNRFIERFMWGAQSKKTSIGLEYNKFTEQGHLHFFSMALLKQQEAYDKKKAKEGAKEGF